MRALAASFCMLLVTIVATACGGSVSRTASQPTVAAAPTATAATTPALAPTTYRTHLERDLAHAFAAALLSTPAPPTESQVPPKLNLLLREPPTVCERLRPGAYRCSLTYQLPAGAPMRVRYAVRRDRRCFKATATAGAIGVGSTLHRLANC